ncbi:unnamed protein product [Arctogadus glacialis]
MAFLWPLPPRLSTLPQKTEDLVESMLLAPPRDRVSALGGLQHPYFSSLPPSIMHLRDNVSVFKVPGVRLEEEVRDISTASRRSKPPLTKFW